jgi:enterochelin esterase-like enzyme
MPEVPVFSLPAPNGRKERMMSFTLKKTVSLLSIPLFLFVTGCVPFNSRPAVAAPTQPPQPTFTPLPTLTPLPAATATGTLPPLGCTDASGRIEKRQIESELIGKTIPVRVYLPPCYPGTAATRYPVLYLLHGQSFTDDQWERLGAPDAADRLILSGVVPPFIIVMPREEYYLLDNTESKYGQALADEIVPWVDREYSTCPLRECRAIGGLSRGAAWAVRVGFVRWELFGAIGGHSLPPFRNDPNNLPRWLEKIPADRRPRLWLDTGDLDTYLSATKQFVELVEKYGLPHEWHLNSGAHNEEYWAAHVEEYLRWYAADW